MAAEDALAREPASRRKRSGGAAGSGRVPAELRETLRASCSPLSRHPPPGPPSSCTRIPARVFSSPLRVSPGVVRGVPAGQSRGGRDEARRSEVRTAHGDLVHVELAVLSAYSFLRFSNSPLKVATMSSAPGERRDCARTEGTKRRSDDLRLGPLGAVVGEFEATDTTMRRQERRSDEQRGKHGGDRQPRSAHGATPSTAVPSRHAAGPRRARHALLP
jgi:hypothetical protein